MAVAQDATSTLPTASNVTSVSWTHTPTGTPTAVAAMTYGFAASSSDTASATYGGVSMSQTVHTSDTTPDIIYLFGLANPASGAKTVAITYSAANYPCAAAITVTGSDTSTCFSNTASNSGNSTSPAVTVSSATNELVICMAGADGSGTFVDHSGAPQTSFFSTANGGEAANAGTAAGAASVACSWDTISTPWAAVAGSFKLAAAGDTLFVGGGLHFI